MTKYLDYNRLEMNDACVPALDWWRIRYGEEKVPVTRDLLNAVRDRSPEWISWLYNAAGLNGEHPALKAGWSAYLRAVTRSQQQAAFDGIVETKMALLLEEANA